MTADNAYEDNLRQMKELANRYGPGGQPNRSETEPQTSEQPDPEAFFQKDIGLVVPDLGGEIARRGHIRLGVDGRLYRYRHGVYLPDGDQFTRRQIRELLGTKYKRRHALEVLDWLRATEPTVTDRPPEQWINCTNGLVDWRTGVLHPHTPDIVSTVQLPVPWKPEAVCPRIDKFFADVLPEDVLPLIYELCGYMLYPGNPLQRAVLLWGSGGNGKTRLLDVLRALVGVSNVVAIPLQTLGEHRFAGADLFGRLANICGDLDARAVKNSDTFKLVTGGDAIFAERKFGQAFSFTPFATFVFSANEPPISSDQSSAWFDRWLIVPMNRRIRGTPAEDPHLEAKLTAPAEIAGLLVRAVESLRTLMERGRFDTPDSIKRAGADYRSKLDTAVAFMEECCIVHPDAWVPRSKLYRHYTEFTKEGGRHALARENFYDHLRRNHDEIEEKTRNGTRGFGGIGLQAEPA